MSKKKCLKSEQSEIIPIQLENVLNFKKNQKEASSCLKGSEGKVRKKTISQFLVNKKENNNPSKRSEANKLKTCLSRTNIRDFYASKRIKS